MRQTEKCDMHAKMLKPEVEHKRHCGRCRGKAMMRLCKIKLGIYNLSMGQTSGHHAMQKQQRKRSNKRERKTTRKGTACASPMLLDIGKGQTSPGMLHLILVEVTTTVDQRTSKYLLKSKVGMFGAMRILVVKSGKGPALSAMIRSR